MMFGAEVHDALIYGVVTLFIALLGWIGSTQWRTSLKLEETSVVLKETTELAKEAASTNKDTNEMLSELHTRLVRVETSIWGVPRPTRINEYALTEEAPEQSA